MDGIRGDHARTAALEEGGEDTRLPGRLGEGARIGVPVRRDGQRRDSQTGDDRLRRASDGDSPVAYGYGLREKFGRGVRLRARRDPHPHRRRLGACRGDDARRRRRDRHGCRTGDAGLRDRRASGTRSALHRRRGDRPDGSVRVGRGDADGGSTSSTSIRRTRANSLSAAPAAWIPWPNSARW